MIDWVLVWDTHRDGCSVEFVEDVPSDDLTFRVSRVVVAEMKRTEIEQARAAKDRHREQAEEVRFPAAIEPPAEFE